jgi:glycosyltransferase involved in cell wall biosynthesis
MEELVSVIMPAYNAAQYIAESIDSVRAQTYKNWELIVVDDGSTDATAEVVRKYCALDARVKYIYQENARQSRARNNGIAHSCGSYIAFLDSDDIWFVDKLHLQMQVLANKSVDLVFGEACSFQEKFDENATKQLLGAGQGIYKGIKGLKAFLAKNQIPTLTVVVSREALTKVASFTEDSRFPNAEDYHLWLKLLLEGATFVGMPAILGAYRMHAASISNSDRLCTNYVLEAKLDLVQKYPEQSGLLESSLVLSVKAMFDELAKDERDNRYAEIKRGLSLMHKEKFNSLISALELFKMRNVALKAGYFILNYL